VKAKAIKPVYVRPGAVCKALGITNQTLVNWCEKGLVRYMRFQTVRYHDPPSALVARPMRRIELASLLEFLEGGETKIHQNARRRLLALKADSWIPPNEAAYAMRRHKAEEDERKKRAS
jgi:hypothetical protein